MEMLRVKLMYDNQPHDTWFLDEIQNASKIIEK